MSILNRIKDDALVARKARETVKGLFLTTLFAESAKVGKDEGSRESTDDEVLDVIRKFIKNTNETVTVLAGAEGQKALTRDQLIMELSLLKGYLPSQASESEVKDVIAQAVKSLVEVNQKQMGVMMGALTAKFAGNFDKKAASIWVKEALTQ